MLRLPWIDILSITRILNALILGLYVDSIILDIRLVAVTLWRVEFLKHHRFLFVCQQILFFFTSRLSDYDWNIAKSYFCPIDYKVYCCCLLLLIISAYCSSVYSSCQLLVLVSKTQDLRRNGFTKAFDPDVPSFCRQHRPSNQPPA